MKNKELIEILQQYDPELQVAVFDYRKNFSEADEDGSSAGIYGDVEVGLVTPEADPDNTEAEVPAHWIALGFRNEEFEEELGPSLRRHCRVCGCTDND